MHMVKANDGHGLALPHPEDTAYAPARPVSEGRDVRADRATVPRFFGRGADVRPLPGWAVMVIRVAWVFALVLALEAPVVAFLLLLAHVVIMPSRHRRQVLGERMDTAVTSLFPRRTR
jgi:hypothetical protein